MFRIISEIDDDKKYNSTNFKQYVYYYTVNNWLGSDQIWGGTGVEGMYQVPLIPELTVIIFPLHNNYSVISVLGEINPAVVGFTR